MLKPPKLERGDKIAVLSSAWGGPSAFPHIFDNGLNFLKDVLGFEIVEFPSTRKDNDYLNKHPEARAKDINDAFADKSISGIIASIGGDDSVRILKYLDKDIILANPKMYMGFSDSTTILTLLNQWGLVTFHGPTVMAGFSQGNVMPESWKRHIKEILFESKNEYVLPQYNWYTDGYPDWNNKSNIGKVKEKQKDVEYNILQGAGIIRGTTFGGNMEVLEFLKSTDYYPQKDFWKGKILFFETSEEVPSVTNIKYFLRNYGVQGIFGEISALIFGRPMSYTSEMKADLNKMILHVVNSEFGIKDLPIITNLNFGHTDPQWILPLGIKMEIDLDKKTLKYIESPFL